MFFSQVPCCNLQLKLPSFYLLYGHMLLLKNLARNLYLLAGKLYHLEVATDLKCGLTFINRAQGLWTNKPIKLVLTDQNVAAK